MRRSFLILTITLGAAFLGGGWITSLYLGGLFALTGSAMIIAGAVLIAGVQISSAIIGGKEPSGRV